MSGLIVTALLARILAPSDFGLVALAALVTQLLNIVTELGLTSALVQRPTVDDRDLSTGFWIALASSILIAAVGWTASRAIGGILHAPEIVPFLHVMLLTLPLSALGQIPDVILQRKLDFKSIARVDWTSGIVSGIAGVIAAWSGLGVWALIIQFVAAALLSTILRLSMVRWTPSFALNQASARRMILFGSGLVAVGLVNYATVNIDNALVGARIGAAALGYYMLAYNLVLLPSTNIGGLVSRVMFPTLSALQSDRHRFVQAYAGMLRVVAVATFPLVVGLGVTAPMAIATIYGPKWAPAIILLEILTTIGVFQSINVSGVAYSAIGKPQLLLAWASLSLVVMTIGFAIGSRWGVTGVAWSYLVVVPIVCLPPHLIANRLIGLPQSEFFRVVGLPLAAALLMGAIVLLVRQAGLLSELPVYVQLILLSSIGGVVYIGVLFGFAHIAGAGGKPVEWITRQTVRISAQ